MDLMSIRLDPEKSDNGVWWYVDDRDWSVCEDPAADVRPKMLIAALPNPNYDKRVQQLSRPYKKRQSVGGEIPDEARKKILARALAECVWLDTKHLEYGGRDIGQDVDLKIAVLMDYHLGRVFTDNLYFCARDDAAYMPTVEAEIKN